MRTAYTARARENRLKPTAAAAVRRRLLSRKPDIDAAELPVGIRLRDRREKSLETPRFLSAPLTTPPRTHTRTSAVRGNSAVAIIAASEMVRFSFAPRNQPGLVRLHAFVAQPRSRTHVVRAKTAGIAPNGRFVGRARVGRSERFPRGARLSRVSVFETGKNVPTYVRSNVTIYCTHTHTRR